MKITDLISDANRNLFNTVNSNTRVVLRKNSGSNCWASELRRDEAIISFVGRENNQAAFAHELLHFDTQFKGYKRIKVGFSELNKNKNFGDLISALDNELQHHKMFPLFKSYGYTDAEFYCGEDVYTEQYLRDSLVYCATNLIGAIINFLTIIAPGGSFNDEVRNQLKELYKNINGYRNYLNNIENIFNRWAQDVSYNAEPYLREFFNQLPGGNLTWLGYGTGKEFPRNGFFTGEAFILKNL